MSRKPDDLSPQNLGDYPQPAYDDPAFYSLHVPDPPRGDVDGGAPEASPLLAPDRPGEAEVSPASEQNAGEMAPADVAGSGSAAKAPGRGRRLAEVVLKARAAVLLLLEIKWVATLSKFGLASLSAVLSAAVYAYLFGWTFALGLIALLFIHEMGHALVMKLKGIPLRGLIFIPMLGAAVLMRHVPGNARDEAEVGIAGPIAGALGALACLALAHARVQATGMPGIWGPLAYFGCLLNLSNLLPMMPFDGGRVIAALDRRIWIVGLLVLVAFQVWQWLTGNPSIWLLFFVIIGATDFLARRRSWRTPEARAYYTVPAVERLIIGLAYFALAVSLVLGMALAHDMMYL